MKGLKKFVVFVGIAGLLAGCGPKDPGGDKVGSETPASGGKGGTYIGTAESFGGPMEVETVLDDAGNITAITVKSHTDTEGYGTVVAEKLPARLVESGRLEDTIAGATVSSKALQSAVANCMEEGGFDPKALGYVPPKEKKKAEKKEVTKFLEKSEKTGSVTVTDVKGRKVTVATPVDAYGVHIMDITDFIVPVIGEEALHKLVAAGDSGGKKAYDDMYNPMFPDLEDQVAIFAGHHEPFDVETLVAVKPDVLFVNSTMQGHRFAAEAEPHLTAAGIPIVYLDIPGKDPKKATVETLDIMGKIFGKEDRAKEAIAFVEEQFKILEDRNLAGQVAKPAVYYEKSGYSEIFGPTQDKNGGWGRIIDLAGGANIMDEVLAGEKKPKGGGTVADPELVLQQNPDFIVLSGVSDLGMGADPSQKVQDFDIVNRPGWKDLEAVKEGHVVEMMHELNRTPTSFYPALALGKEFYPQLMADVDPDRALAQWYDTFMLVPASNGVWMATMKDGSQ